jgi:uncharacterized membrane protein YfcA
MAAGVTAGSVGGWAIADRLDERTLRLLFGFVLLYIAAYTILTTMKSHHMMRSMVLAGVVSLVLAGVYLGLRVLDARQG